MKPLELARHWETKAQNEIKVRQPNGNRARGGPGPPDLISVSLCSSVRLHNCGLEKEEDGAVGLGEDLEQEH